ncbi:substrate-binding domain-containing protein [Mycobacterium sp. 3519A]|uniref:substrate-binding domain-containing protein n=1 Tax=Mycobacterium sp. 3519A TaxID=2057184 RepID=UPI000C7D8151|nr:substrate-binding domain-containing protein [Mycobacterium sp. 3519A]
MTGPGSTRSRAETWRLAMVVPLQGPGGVFGPACEAVSRLAAADLNAAGGVLGREVHVEIVDGGADPALVAHTVDRLVSEERIDAVSGWHISSVRNALAPIVAGRIPYAYPALYEGGEKRRDIYCCGETPDGQIGPALRWLRDNVGVRRWFIVGDDYIWPRSSMAAVRRYAKDLDLQIVGRRFVDLGCVDMTGVVKDALESGCDAVMMLLVGQDAIEFNRVCAEVGADEAFVRFSPLMDESMLLASGDEGTHGLFVAASYFRSMVGAGSMELLGRYLHLHGPTAPPLSGIAESCYEGPQLLAQLIHRAGRLTEIATSECVAYETPRGTVQFSADVTEQPVHLAVADGFDFDVLTTLNRR